MKSLFVWLPLMFAGFAQAQSVELQVELMNQVGTDVSRKGDLISGRVVTPAQFQGDIVEGKVTNAQSSGRMRGKAALRFSFETLRHAGQAIPISSEIRSMANSKGQIDVDEEGNAIRKNNNLAKTAGGAAAGGLLGGLIGGGKGAAIGAASGALVSIVVIDLASDGPNIRLAPGSKITLLAKSRSGPELTSFSANQGAGAPTGSAAAAPVVTSPSPASSAGTGTTSQPAASAADTGNQPNLTAVKSDFVPGDKAIFYDDYTDMAGDEPPPHWKVRGGTAELRVGGGVRQMTMTASRMTLSPNLTALPKNFTMEADVAYKGHGGVAWWRFHNKAGAGVLDIRTAVNYSNFALTIRKGDEELASQQIPMDWSRPVKQALWLQNGRMRFYLNGQRVMDVNQITMPELGKIEVYVDGPGRNDPTGYVGFQFVRFAESTPDFSQVISSSGRFVTHGILFDTDSDRIKPESAPVINMIARGLTANPALKLQIEGHTDSVGNANHNLDLSKRRAEAVKAVLVSQFSVDASRLTTTGLGASKPIDSNDTAQGRAQNRRVEFVKQ
ncbi:MAG: OmpA family protein [Bryobacteraceae bacterium]